jgi:hypothetical protein
MNRFNVDQGTSGLSASVEMEGPSRRSLASMASMASMASIASMVVVEIHEVSANDHPVRTIIEVVAMKRKGNGNGKDTKKTPVRERASNRFVCRSGSHLVEAVLGVIW